MVTLNPKSHIPAQSDAARYKPKDVLMAAWKNVIPVAVLPVLQSSRLNVIVEKLNSRSAVVNFTLTVPTWNRPILNCYLAVKFVIVISHVVYILANKPAIQMIAKNV